MITGYVLFKYVTLNIITDICIALVIGILSSVIVANNWRDFEHRIEYDKDYTGFNAIIDALIFFVFGDIIFYSLVLKQLYKNVTRK